MPAYVTTSAEFDALVARVAAAEADIAELDVRVAALEDAEPIPPDPPDPPVAGTLQAVVTLAGQTYTFNEADAQDIGDYTDPDGRFVMSCKRATDPNLADFRVDFRRIEGWSCIVFELGTIIGAVPHHLPGYSVDITKDDGSTETIGVPSHWWYASWRWQSGKWPHVRKASEIFAKGWSPILDPSVNTGAQGRMPVATYSPMSTGGLTPGMAQTGGRADIGWMTTWEGQALCFDDDESWSSVLAQGEGMASFPIRYRDVATNAPLDAFVAHPTATFYYPPNGEQLQFGPGRNTCQITYKGPPGSAWVPYAQGKPCETIDNARNYFWTYPPATGIVIPDSGSVTWDAVQGSGTSPAQSTLTGAPAGWTADMVPGSWVQVCPNSLDTAHMPDAPWAAFLRTGDPYFLETLQCQVIEAFTETPRSKPQCGRQDQGRAVAWSIRTTLEAWTHTPDAVPSWLLTKDVLKEAVDQCLACTANMMNDGRTLRSAFNLPDFGLTMTASPPQGSCAGPWQADFAICSAAWAAVLDPRFADYAAYCVQHAVARCDNQSGWPGGNAPCYTIVYRVNDQDLTSWRAAFDATVPYDASLTENTTLTFTSSSALDYPQQWYAGMAMCEQARTKHGVSALPDVSQYRDLVLAALQDAYARMPNTRLAWGWCVG